jgi:hypothetical protein
MGEQLTVTQEPKFVYARMVEPRPSQTEPPTLDAQRITAQVNCNRWRRPDRHFFALIIPGDEFDNERELTFPVRQQKEQVYLGNNERKVGWRRQRVEEILQGMP